MKNRLNYFSKKSINFQIMSVSLLVSTIISVLIVGICYTAFSRLLSENDIRSSEYNLSLAVSAFNSDMENILDFAKWCQADSDIQHYLQNAENYQEDPSIKTLFNVSSVQTYEKVNKEFFSSSLPYLDRVIISTNTGKYYIHIMAKTIPSNYSPAETILEQPFFQSYMDSPGYVWDRIENDLFSSRLNRQFIPIIRPIYLNPSRQIGFLYMEVSTDIFKNTLSSYPYSVSPRIAFSGNSYYLDQGKFASCPNPLEGLTPAPLSFLRPDIQFYTSGSIFHKDRALSMKSAIPDIIFSQKVYRQSLLSQDFSLYFMILPMVFILILTGGFLISHTLNRLVSEPIQTICCKIRGISQGDFSREPEIEYTNELGDIGKCINTMSENVVSLMDKRLADEKHRQELEYRILQSQINPHFLYNTLNSIKWMASIQGAGGVADMITSLSRLMKTVAKAGDSLVPLSRELEFLNDYFFIQRHRYGGGVKLVYELEDEALKSCLLHRFSLQPIVENALFHGIEPKGGKGCITIHAASVNQEKLIITITDDGVGMTQDMIQKALSGTDEVRHDFFRQVGIPNVNQRIQRSFGSGYGISIQSVPGEYTSMIFTLPYLTEHSPVFQAKERNSYV